MFWSAWRRPHRAAVAGLSGASATPPRSACCGRQAIPGSAPGLLLPTTLALIAHVVPDPRERGKYIGIWATGLLLGLAAGPLVSGVILDHASYGWTFLPTVALAALAGAAALARLPESKAPEGRRLDWPGQITGAIAIAASIYGVIEGGSKGWSARATVAGLGAGAAMFAAFIVAERRWVSPLFNLTLFKSAAFTAAGFSALIALFSVVGVTFLLSLFLGYVQPSALQIGWRLLFITGVAAVLNPVIGRVMHKVKVLYLLAVGLAVSAVSVFLLTGVNPHTSLAGLGWRLAIFGLSLAIMLTTVSVAAINAVPWKLAGMAAAANTAMRQYGSALGPAILGVIFVNRTSTGASPTSALHTALVVNGSSSPSPPSPVSSPPAPPSATRHKGSKQMEVLLTLVWFLAGATTGWVLTLVQAARTTSRARQQMRSEIRHWQSETERYKATADRHAQNKAAWAAARQGRDDVITIMPMLLAAQHRPPSQNGAAGATPLRRHQNRPGPAPHDLRGVTDMSSSSLTQTRPPGRARTPTVSAAHQPVHRLPIPAAWLVRSSPAVHQWAIISGRPGAGPADRGLPHCRHLPASLVQPGAHDYQRDG